MAPSPIIAPAISPSISACGDHAVTACWPMRAEIELGHDRIAGERRRRAFVPQLAVDQDDAAMRDGERGLHVLLDQHDGDAGLR